MKLRVNGILYMDEDEVQRMAKSQDETIKKRLEKLRGKFQLIKWHKINPLEQPNREKRRKKINPNYGYMKNNHEDRTKHKNF